MTLSSKADVSAAKLQADIDASLDAASLSPGDSQQKIALDGFRGPSVDPATSLRAKLSQVQEARISYELPSGGAGYVDVGVGPQRRDGRIAIEVRDSSADFPGGQFLYPAVDSNDILRLLPGKGINPRIELGAEQQRPPGEFLLAQATGPGGMPGGPGTSPAPARTPTAIALGTELAKFKGKDALMIFHRDGTYYYLRAQLKASQSGGGPDPQRDDPSYPKSRVYVEKNPPKIDKAILDARLTQIAKQLRLPAGTKLQALPLKESKWKPKTDIHNVLGKHISKHPPLSDGVMNPELVTKRFKRLGLTPIAVVDTIPGQGAASIPTPQPAKPLRATPLRPQQVSTAIGGSRGEEMIFVLPSEGNPNQVEVVAGRVFSGRLGITGHMKVTRNEENRRYKPTAADKQKVAALFGINPDQVVELNANGRLAMDVERNTGNEARITIVVNRTQVNLNSTTPQIYGIIPRN